MQQTRTAKFQILPGEQDRQLLRDTMRAYADACSYVADRIASEKIPLNLEKVHQAVYRENRSRFALPSQMAISVDRTVIGAFRSVRTNQMEHPERFRKARRKEGQIVPEFRKPQLSLVWNRDYSIIRNRNTAERLFSVNTLRGRIKVTFKTKGMEWAFTEDAKFGTAKLVYKHGKFFLHVPVTLPVPDPPEPSECQAIVGIDRGIRFLTVSYDGEKTSFASGKEIKKRRAHYKKIRQELQMKQTSSARRRIRAIGQRENRWMNDVNHCMSKALADRYPQGTLFVLEDLTGIRSATERVRTEDRYVSVSWPYYDLEQKLTYKAVRNGSSVIKVDPAYTSQTCPVCGHREKKNRNRENHVFCCRKCGYTTNDDRAAAMNLRRMGIQYLAGAQVSEKDTA